MYEQSFLTAAVQNMKRIARAFRSLFSVLPYAFRGCFQKKAAPLSAVCVAPRGANSPPARHRREASALRAVARSAKRPAGVSKYKGCARSAQNADICERANTRAARGQRAERDICEGAKRAVGAVSALAKIERPGKAARFEFTLEGTEGSVSPVARREACALWALGPKAKATRRREQIQGLRAASAQSADICEGSETMSAPKGSVSPVGCCAKRKATRRRTAKRAWARPAPSATIERA